MPRREGEVFRFGTAMAEILLNWQRCARRSPLSKDRLAHRIHTEIRGRAYSGTSPVWLEPPRRAGEAPAAALGTNGLPGQSARARIGRTVKPGFKSGALDPACRC